MGAVRPLYGFKLCLSGGGGIPSDEIQKIEAFTHKGFAPDLTVLLICNIEICMQRCMQRVTCHHCVPFDRFENKPLDFLSVRNELI